MAALTLGTRLAEALRERKMSPAALAREARTSEATISNWLNDNVQPDHVKAKLLFAITAAAGVEPAWLLSGEGRRDRLSVAEQAVTYGSQPVSRDTLRIALQQVSEVVDTHNLPMTPAKRAELTLAVCEMLEDGLSEAKVLRFVRAAAA